MKKHLQYLWAALFAVAALPAVAQTEESPQVVMLGENTVNTETTYFTFTCPKDALVKIDGIAMSVYYSGALKTTDDEGKTINVPYAYNAYGHLWMAFYAEAGKTYTFSYEKAWNQNLPFTFDCTATPITEGSMTGATCADPIVMPENGQALFPFVNQMTPTTAYMKYEAEATGRLIVHASSSINSLYAGFSCDDIDADMGYGDYDSVNDVVNYDGNFPVEKGDVVYLKAMGSSAVLVSCSVEDMTPGASCKDAFQGKVGENVIPAPAGTYWYTFRNPDDTTRYFVYSTDATNLIATFAADCGYSGIRKEDLNYKETVGSLGKRVLQIEKTVATDTDETFTFEIVPLDPVDDADVGQSITAGEQVTTPDATAYYYYTLTAPEGAPMLMVISSNADEKNYDGYNPAISVMEFGSFSKLNNFTDNPCNFKLKTTPGMKYMFKADVKYNTPFTFSVSFETLEPGSLKSTPIESKLGSNEIPAFSPVYYTFTDAEGMKLQLSADVKDATITAQYVDKTWGSASYYDKALNKNENGYWLKVEPGKEYIFTLNNPEETKGNLELTELPFGVGEAWQTAKEVEAGTYNLPNAPMEYWYKLTAPQDGFITVSSNMSAINYSNELYIYLNDVTGTPVIGQRDSDTYPDYVYSEVKAGVFKDQVIYVKFLSYDEQAGITATFGFMNADPGQTASTAIKLDYVDGGLTYDFPGNLGYDYTAYKYNEQWYSIDLPAGIFSATSKDQIGFNLYSVDNTSLALVSGDWHYGQDYGILWYTIEEAGTYYLTVFNTESTPAKEVVPATILVRDPLPGETIATAIEVSEAGQTVEVPMTDGDDFFVKINVYPGELTFLTEPDEYLYAFLYNESNLTNEVAEVESKYDAETGTMICGLINFEVKEKTSYILRIYNCQNGATLTFSGSAFDDVPAIPDSYNITLDVEGLELTQGEEQGVYEVNVTGVADVETVTLTFEVPEGWDGFIGMTDADMDPEINPLKVKAIAETEWAPIDEMLAWGFKKTNKLTFPADGEDHSGAIFLYKGDMVDEANQIAVYVNVAQPQSIVVPESYKITMDVEGLELTQGDDQGVYTVNVTGETESENATLTFDVPEGWDGFIGMTDADMDPEINPLKVKAIAETEWAPIDEMLAWGFKKTNTLTFPVDGEEHFGSLYLYKGNLVDEANQIMVFFSVELNRTKVNVNVEVEDGASFGFILPVDFTTPLNLNLPENFVVETAELNGEEIEVTDSYEVTTAQEDLNYVFTVAYDGDLEFVDSTTGLVELDTRVKIGVVDGKIRIEGTEVGDAVAVYTVGGMTVGTYVAQNTALEIALPAGTYIVRVNNNAAKVML